MASEEPPLSAPATPAPATPGEASEPEKVEKPGSLKNPRKACATFDPYKAPQGKGSDSHEGYEETKAGS